MAQEILTHPNMIGMLATLELDHPAKNKITLRDGFDATYKLGRIEGFEECLSMLRDLGKPAPLPLEHITATWGAEETEPKK